MKYVGREHHVEVIPETPEEVEELRKQYPHLWPFRSVCVANEPEEKVKINKSTGRP